MDIEKQLIQIEEKTDAIYIATEKTRKYILTMLIITVITVAIPLLGAVALVPTLIGILGEAYQI